MSRSSCIWVDSSGASLAAVAALRARSGQLPPATAAIASSGSHACHLRILVERSRGGDRNGIVQRPAGELRANVSKISAFA
jgi:acetyl esterase/lipase